MLEPIDHHLHTHRHVDDHGRVLIHNHLHSADHHEPEPEETEIEEVHHPSVAWWKDWWGRLKFW